MTRDDAANRKRKLRAQLRQLREAIPADGRAKADQAICERVAGLEEYADAHLVLSYLSFGTEVDTHPLVERAWADGKVVAIPWCVPGARQMRWYRIASYEGLVKGPIGVLEPNPNTFEEVDANAFGTTSVSVVPGLSFDAMGHRLGYGGGFYDAFLAAFQGVSVGLCREAQLAADLRAQGAVDAHDLPVDIVVTEARTLSQMRLARR